MTAANPNRLSITGTVRHSLRAWRRDWLYLTALGALVEIPFILVQLAVIGATDVTVSSELGFAASFLVLVFFMWNSLDHHFLSGAIEGLEGAEEHGRPRPTIRLLLRELPWLRLLAADVLVTLAFLVGLVLFVIPGFIAATYLAIALPIVNLERQPVMASLRRSVELVRGNFRPVLAVWLGAQIFTTVMVQLIAGLAGRISHNDVFELVTHVAPEALFAPISAVPAVIMAFELVAIDRARRAATPDAASGPAAGD